LRGLDLFEQVLLATMKGMKEQIHAAIDRRRAMFIVLLRFAAEKSRAPELMKAHGAWIERGFDEGVFLVVGGLQPGLGGVVVAHDITRSDLDVRVGADPFVAHGVVTAEVLEVSPAKTDPRLGFLLADRGERAELRPVAEEQR
jgi:uncharacterized protein YciI